MCLLSYLVELRLELTDAAIQALGTVHHGDMRLAGGDHDVAMRRDLLVRLQVQAGQWHDRHVAEYERCDRLHSHMRYYEFGMWLRVKTPPR